MLCRGGNVSNFTIKWLALFVRGHKQDLGRESDNCSQVKLLMQICTKQVIEHRSRHLCMSMSVCRSQVGTSRKAPSKFPVSDFIACAFNWSLIISSRHRAAQVVTLWVLCTVKSFTMCCKSNFACSFILNVQYYTAHSAPLGSLPGPQTPRRASSALTTGTIAKQDDRVVHTSPTVDEIAQFAFLLFNRLDFKCSDGQKKYYTITFKHF